MASGRRWASEDEVCLEGAVVEEGGRPGARLGQVGRVLDSRSMEELIWRDNMDRFSGYFIRMKPGGGQGRDIGGRRVEDRPGGPLPLPLHPAQGQGLRGCEGQVMVIRWEVKSLKYDYLF